MRRLFTATLASIVFASAAQAQGAFTFQIDQANSNFNWSGTSSLGPIVGNPSTAFQMSGTAGLTLTPSGADPIASGTLPGTGDAAVVPDLRGKINNPFPFLPPLATIEVNGLHLSFAAPSYAIASNGAFTANVTVTALAGTLVVTPLGSSASSSSLAGLTSTPQAQSGTLTPSGLDLQLALPVNTTFPFSDPTTGASGTITIVGTLRANWSCPASTTYCTAKVNSLGCTPAIAVSGAASYSSNSACTLSASNIVAERSGLLFYGFGPNSAPFQGGFLCVQPPTIRTLIQNSGGTVGGGDCSGVFSIDFNDTIQGLTDANLYPGREVFTQYWSRDPASASTTNLTNAAKLTICP
jgi:hypothetical protein